MSDDKYTYYHNKGEKDVEKGKFDPPNGAVGELLFGSDPKENEAYITGRSNAMAQRDAEKGKYNPTGNKDVYDKSWRATKDNMK